MNSTKLFAFCLIALGMMAFAYHDLPDPARAPEILSEAPVAPAARALPLVMIAGLVSLAGGIAVLVIDWTEQPI